MTDIPVACALDPVTLEQQKSGLLPGLVRQASVRAPLSEGLRLTFAATSDVLAAITRTVDAERQCCPFLRFQLTVEPAGGPVVLEVTGPPGTRALLDQLEAAG